MRKKDMTDDSKKWYKGKLLWGILALLIVIGIALFILYNNINANRTYDASVYTPIPVVESAIVPSPRSTIIDFYNNNKEDFNKAFAFLLNSTTAYQISNGAGTSSGQFILKVVPDIQDQAMKDVFTKLLKQTNGGYFFSDFTKDPNVDMMGWFFYDGVENLYMRGLVSFKDVPSGKALLTSNGNSMWDSQDLGNNIFFYYNHNDTILHQDDFKNIAFNALSNDQRASLATSANDAKIEIASYPQNDNSDSNGKAIVVTFKTNKTGSAYDIKVYIDGISRKVIKVGTFGEELMGLQSTLG
jgi:uncharacterized protein YxeA